MPNNDSHLHVVKTTAQWEERAVEFWVVPRGCLCVELTPNGKTKLKIGEGSKYYSQLPYICDGHDLSQYYTKNEIDNLFENLNRMAIMSTNEYDSKSDLPINGNKLGDVRFVKSSSPSVKTDPDIYLWDGSKWVFVGYEFKDIDLSQYLKKDEFHEAFDPVKIQVDEMYPIRHTHLNKDILDNTTASYTIPEKEKLAGLKNYDDTEIRKLIHDSSHTHDNKDLLDTITPESLWSEADRKKFESIVDYGDDIIEIRADIKVLYDMAHTHDNKDILDKVEEPYTTAEKEKLAGLSNPEVFIGTDGFYPGKEGIVPAPSVLDVGKFLSSNGTWMPAGDELLPATTDILGGIKVGTGLFMTDDDHLCLDASAVKTRYEAGDGIEIVADYQQSTTFPLKIFGKSTMLKEYIIYGNNPPVGDWDGSAYCIPVVVSAEGRVPIETMIRIPTQLSEGDYIDYEKQIYSHYRTQIHYGYTAGASRSAGLKYDGTITGTGSLYSAPGVTEYIEVNPKYTYLVRWKSDMGWNTSSGPLYPFYHIFYDSNKNILSRISIGIKAGDRLLTPPENAKYLRLTTFCDGYNKQFGELYRIGSTIEPIILPRVMVHANVISYVDVNTTTKPAEMYIEAEIDQGESEEESKITGIIYNLGVLDLVQDEENKNKVTVVFKDSTKDIIFEDGGGSYIEGTGIELIEVEDPDLGTVHSINVLPATTDTLGGIIVGDGLKIDPDTGVLDVIPGGKMYSEIDDAKVFTLLREKPDDWDSFWMEYFSMDYFELTEKPEKFDATKHYKYMNDAYVRGEPTDTWEGPIWYDKHYSSLPLTEHVEFIPDLYYTSKLIQPTDGETIGESLSKINEDLQQLSGRIDNKVSVKMKDETSENLMFF